MVNLNGTIRTSSAPAVSRRSAHFDAGLDIAPPPVISPGKGMTLFVAGWHSRLDASARTAVLALGDTRMKLRAFDLPWDAEGHRRAFWGELSLAPEHPSGVYALNLVAILSDGSHANATLGEVTVMPGASPPKVLPGFKPPPVTRRTVVVCMATFNPSPQLLKRQLESICNQTYSDWVCLIGDDGSASEIHGRIAALAAQDDRLVLVPFAERVGFYRNFERLLGAVPSSAGFVALADQDDVWHPRKLESLVSHLGSRALAFSDARIVSSEGNVQSPTFWTVRRPNHESLASLLLTNSVSGASLLFRRDLLDSALPFPPAHGRFFHDHWLATVAAANGGITYVDQPLYDYVQHSGAAIGHERMNRWARRPRSLGARAAHAGRDPGYFMEHWRVTYFTEYVRTLLFARTLLQRCDVEDTAHRPLRMLIAPDGSTSKTAWLLARHLRELRANETLRAEGRLLRALTWRGLLQLRGRRAGRVPHWLPTGTAARLVPPTDPRETDPRSAGHRI